MSNIIFYNDSKVLDHKIRKAHYIPYHIRKRERYKEKQRYYNYYWDMCYKVIHINNYECNNRFLSVYIKADDNTFHLLATELDAYDYLLLKDNEEIYKKDIINSDYTYRGAEIVYWFYVNDINLNSKKYLGFRKFVDNNSNFRISDVNRYIITADINNKENFINCKIKRIK